MCRMISCLVDRRGKVYAADGVHSHSAIARTHGISQDGCLAYEYHLDEPASQRLYQDFTLDGAPFKAMASHDQAALNFFNDCASTPERLIAFVLRGNWSDELPRLLTPEARVLCNNTFAEALALRDKTRAKALALRDKTCAKARVFYDNTFYQPVAFYNQTRFEAWVLCDKTRAEAQALYDKTRAEAPAFYDKTCVEVWGKLFKDPKNRIPAWKC